MAIIYSGSHESMRQHRLNEAIVSNYMTYMACVGRLFRVDYLCGYLDNDSCDRECDAIVKIMPTSEADRNHVNGDWVDPYWDVKLIAGDEKSRTLRSIWIDGPSVNIYTGELQWEGVTPCGWLDVLRMKWRYRHV